MQEKEDIHMGYVIKVGPGYPFPSMDDLEESWKKKTKQVKYIPLQAKEGDLAVYLQKSGYEIQFDRNKYVVVPQSAILLLLRDEGMFE